MGCFSGRLMSAASDQKLFCKLCSPFCCSFDEFVEEKVVSPSYSSTILTPPPHHPLKPFLYLFYNMYFLFLSLLAVPDSAAPWSLAHQVPLSVELPGRNTVVGCHILLLGIFPTQGSNLGLL